MHIEDSLQGLEELKKAPEGEFVDLGSGAGFPGIPLSIVSKRKATLVESVGKKCDCLDSFINELGLDSQISVSNQRIEELAEQKPNFYAAASARALSSLPSLLELASPLLMTKGLLICYKSESIEEELEQANNIAKKLGFELFAQRNYVLGEKIANRKMIVYKKIGDAEVKLPRKLGMAQKRPLV